MVTESVVERVYQVLPSIIANAVLIVLMFVIPALLRSLFRKSRVSYPFSPLFTEQDMMASIEKPFTEVLRA